MTRRADARIVALALSAAFVAGASVHAALGAYVAEALRRGAARRTLPDESAFAAFLVARGYVGAPAVETALDEQRRTGDSIGRILVGAGAIDHDELPHVLRRFTESAPT